MNTQPNITPELSAKVEKAAALSGIAPGEIIERVLTNGIDDWMAEHRRIKKAIDQANRGEFATDDDVQRVLNKYRPEA